MTAQVTLLTSHKGVDLHAATARRVMQDRLAGGDLLLALARAEYHTFWPAAGAAEAAAASEAAPTVARLLATGRFFNPNKHHHGHFRLAEAGVPWLGRSHVCRGEALSAAWPGVPIMTDLGAPDAGLLDRLLGVGPLPAGAVIVDVCAFPLGEPQPLLSGVLWRLVLAPGIGDPATLADSLAVARSARQGLLINPHMEGWLVAVRGGTPGDGR